MPARQPWHYSALKRLQEPGTAACTAINTALKREAWGHGFVVSLSYIARSLPQKTSGVLSGGCTDVPWQIQRKMATMGEKPCLEGSPRPQHCTSPISRALVSNKSSPYCRDPGLESCGSPLIICRQLSAFPV